MTPIRPATQLGGGCGMRSRTAGATRTERWFGPLNCSPSRVTKRLDCNERDIDKRALLRDAVWGRSSCQEGGRGMSCRRCGSHHTRRRSCAPGADSSWTMVYGANVCDSLPSLDKANV